MAAIDIRNVILVGASGNLGSTVLEQFLSSPFKVTVLSRPDSTAKLPSGVQVIRATYEVPDLVAAFRGQDAIVSLVGNAAFKYQKRFIDAAIIANVKRFIPSEYGNDTACARVRGIAPILESKRDIIVYLERRQSQISWTALISGPFVDWGLRNGFLGFDLATQTATIFDKGIVPASFSTLSQVARGIVKILEHTSQTDNTYVYISSFRATQLDILDQLQTATGKKWLTSEADMGSAVAKAQTKLSNGDLSDLRILLLAPPYQAGQGQLGDWTEGDRELWNQKIGLAKESLSDIVNDVIRAQVPKGPVL